MVICPICKSKDTIKKGFTTKGIQRRLCKNCNKIFFDDNNNLKFEQNGDSAIGTYNSKGAPKTVDEVIKFYTKELYICSYFFIIFL